jgi:hypothetical protein
MSDLEFGIGFAGGLFCLCFGGIFLYAIVRGIIEEIRDPWTGPRGRGVGGTGPDGRREGPQAQ